MASQRMRLASVAAGLLLSMVLPGVASADGSVSCSSSGSFYTVMGESAAATSSDNISASLEAQAFNRCNGTDPNGKNGGFVYVELVERYETDASGVQFAYDDSAHPEYYGNYLRFGYYDCSWSGDSACGQGLGYFISWSRNDSHSGCSGSDAIGIHRLGTPSSGFHTLKIDVLSSGAVEFRRSGTLLYSLSASATGCWNQDTDITGTALSTAWDPGDQIGGSVTNHVQIDTFSVNGGTASTTCNLTTLDSYRCSDTGARDIDLWTIDR